MDDGRAIASPEFLEGRMEPSIVFDAFLSYVEYRELTRREGREMSEGDPYRPIVPSRFIGFMEEGTEGIYHTLSIDRCLSEIRVFRSIGEGLESEKYPDKASALSFAHEGLIGAFEVDEGLAPEEVRVARDSRIEGAGDDDTLSSLHGISRVPGVHAVELTPEDDAIFPEEFLDISRVHGVEIIDRTDMDSESIRTPTSDEGDFADGQFFPEFLDFIRIPDDRCSVWFTQIAKHLGSYSSIGYPYRDRDADIVIDRHLEVMSELFILRCHTTHGGEGLIDRKYFELSEASFEISHETLGYFSIEGMVGMLLYEVFSYDAFCLPKWCPHTDTKALCLIARRDRDLISDDDGFSLETWVSQDFARCIK